VKGEKKHSSDHESNEEPSEDELIKDNAMKRLLRKVKKAQEQKNKTAEKAYNFQLEEMKRMLAHHEQGVEKRITERLAEQTRKHDEYLKALKQSQAAINNIFTSHNPYRVISYKAVEHYKNMTKASDVLFDGNADNWQTFEDHLAKEADNLTISWSKDILGFQIMGQCHFVNLLETYCNIPQT
jgi:hypothetical protein